MLSEIRTCLDIFCNICYAFFEKEFAVDYITIVASSYEEAVKQARRQYGDRLRIHSRKDGFKPNAFGFGKTPYCEISCFLAEKEFTIPETVKEAPHPAETQKDSPPPAETEKIDIAVDFYLDLAKNILRKNEFSENYINWCVNEVREQLVSLASSAVTEEDLELILLDVIVGSVDIGYRMQSNPKRICVVLGSKGSGKTTCVAKLAATFNSASFAFRRNVRIVSLDDTPSVVNQLNKLASVLEINVDIAKHESELEQALREHYGNELVLVDTFGKDINTNEPDYRLYGLMNVAAQDSTEFFVTVPATMKNSDIETVFEQFKNFDISGLIVTMLDETVTVGNAVSVIHDRNIPIVFVSDGKKIPKDFRNASVADVMKNLKGFRINIQKVLEKEDD